MASTKGIRTPDLLWSQHACLRTRTTLKDLSQDALPTELRTNTLDEGAAFHRFRWSYGHSTSTAPRGLLTASPALVAFGRRRGLEPLPIQGLKHESNVLRGASRPPPRSARFPLPSRDGQDRTGDHSPPRRVRYRCATSRCGMRHAAANYRHISTSLQYSLTKTSSTSLFRV